MGTLPATIAFAPRFPVAGSANARSQLLEGLSTLRRGVGMAVVSHYNVQPVIDIFGDTQGRDLGAVSGDINKILAEAKKDLPRGSYTAVRGQVQTMNNAYLELYLGLAGAIVLIYLVIVVNFQSWLDPFIIITALPGALAGIAISVLLVVAALPFLELIAGIILMLALNWQLAAISLLVFPITLIGPPGSGQITKMMNQMCIAGIVQGLAEVAIHVADAPFPARQVLLTAPDQSQSE